jgi:hypothetical protein
MPHLSSVARRQQRSLRNLVSGVTRWRRRLDYYVSLQLNSGSYDLEPCVRVVLRVALFELLFLNLAPHALGQFVDITRVALSAGSSSSSSGVYHEGAARLVNKVLRSAAKQLESGRLTDPLWVRVCPCIAADCTVQCFELSCWPTRSCCIHPPTTADFEPHECVRMVACVRACRCCYVYLTHTG